MPWSDPGGSGNQKGSQNGNQNPWGQRSKASGTSWNIDKITQELRRLGGRVKNGRRRGVPRPQKQWFRWVPGVAIAAVVLAWLFSGFYMVGPGQEGVVLQFGRVVSVSSPGSHYHLPYPFQAALLVDVGRSRRLVLGYGGVDESPNPGRMLTADGKIVDVRYAAQYRIANVQEYLFSTVNPQQILADMLASAMRQAVAGQDFDALFNAPKAPLAHSVLVHADTFLAGAHSGLKLESLQILEISPPRALQPDFAAVRKAGKTAGEEQDAARAEVEKLQVQAKEQAAERVTAARAEASRLVTRARGDAERFDDVLQAYEKNPKIVAEQMYLETMQDILTHARKIVVSGKNGATTLELGLPPSAVHNSHQGAPSGSATVSVFPSGRAEGGRKTSVPAGRNIPEALRPGFHGTKGGAA